MLTPLDIESKEFGTGVGGYNKSEVNQFLKEVLSNYEKMYKENIELKDKMNMLNEGISYYKTMEETMQNTLVIAEKVAEETKSAAREKAAAIEESASTEAQRILLDAKKNVSRISELENTMLANYVANKIQIKQFLSAQLEMIENSDEVIEKVKNELNNSNLEISKVKANEDIEEDGIEKVRSLFNKTDDNEAKKILSE